MKTKKPYIYIVDDNKVSLKLLQRKIKELTNYNVRTFVSAEECLRILQLRTPALILSDLNLDSEAPGNMNGDKFLKIIRNYDPQLPVIMYSSSNSIDVIMNLIKDGAKSFIPRNKNFVKEISSVTLNVLNYPNGVKGDYSFRQVLVIGIVLMIIITTINFLLWRRSFPWLSIISFLLIASWVTHKGVQRSKDSLDIKLKNY